MLHSFSVASYQLAARLKNAAVTSSRTGIACFSSSSSSSSSSSPFHRWGTSPFAATVTTAAASSLRTWSSLPSVFASPSASSASSLSLSVFFPFSSSNTSLSSASSLSPALFGSHTISRSISSAEASIAKKVKLDLQIKFSDKVKKFNPVTPGQRHLVLLDKSELHKGKPFRKLTVAKRSKAGRSHGTIAVRHRGGGHKRRHRLVDLKRTILDFPGTVERLEYDPNRNAHLALIRYSQYDGLVSKTNTVVARSADGKDVLQYIIAPQNLSPGDTIVASRSKEIEVREGNAMPLHRVPIGTKVYCLELLPNKGAQVSRSAGTFCQVLEKENTGRKNHALVRICSKETRLVPLDSLCTIGEVSNPLHKLIQLGKAGRSRWLGIRPTVRGLAMNPVDHAHGGGGAKGREGRASCSPNGLLAKGFKTRRKRKNSSLIVVPRGGLKKSK